MSSSGLYQPAESPDTPRTKSIELLLVLLVPAATAATETEITVTTVSDASNGDVSSPRPGPDERHPGVARLFGRPFVLARACSIVATIVSGSTPFSR